MSLVALGVTGGIGAYKAVEIARGLQNRGHEVVALTSGEGLLQAVGQNHPALVLMDIQLPGKDGYALLKELRQSEHKSVRVVALTAHAMSGDREKAINAGFDGYITKPIDIRAFPDQISRALDGEMVTT